MADKTITIPEPNATTRRPQITIAPDGTISLMYFVAGHTYAADVQLSALPAPTRVQLNAAFGVILGQALSRFRRTDGGDNAGF